MRRIVAAPIILIFALSIFACAKPQTVKPYAVTKATAESILYSARMMQNQGELTEAEFNMVKTYYDAVKEAQDIAIDARKTLIMYHTDESELKYQTAIARLTNILSQLLTLANQLGIDTGGK